MENLDGGGSLGRERVWFQFCGNLTMEPPDQMDLERYCLGVFLLKGEFLGETNLRFGFIRVKKGLESFFFKDSVFSRILIIVNGHRRTNTNDDD